MDNRTVTYKDVTIFINTSNPAEIVLSCCKTAPAGVACRHVGEKVYNATNVEVALNDYVDYLDHIRFAH